MQSVNTSYGSTREKSVMDILDYSYLDLDFQDLYEKDSRIEKYHSAYIIPYPELKNWTMAGRFINQDTTLGGTRTNCGQVRGIIKSKFKIGKPKPLINNCGKLQCKVCFRESSSIKAMKIMDHLDSVMYRFMFDNVKFTRSRIRNLDFKHVSFNPASISEGVRDWSHLLKYFENYDSYLKNVYLPVKRIVDKYFLGAVITLHLYRFWDQEGTVLFFSPHFHVVGIGNLPSWKNFIRRHGKTFKGGTKKEPKYWGINYWNMQNKESGLYLLPEKKDIGASIKYILSHSGLCMYDQKRLNRQSKQEKENNDERTYSTIRASKISYHYLNAFSSQKYKVEKEFKYKVSLRDENNDLYYEVIDGFVLQGESLNGKKAILLPSDMVDTENPVNFYVTDKIKIYLDYDRLKFGNRIKRKKKLKVLKKR